MPTFVVFGAAGRLGASTVHELRAKNQTVRAVLHNASQAERFRSMGCEVAIADLHDSNSIKAALSDAEAVQVICPPNPRAAQPLQEMALIADSFFRALAQVRPKLVVAISDYGAERDSKTGVTLAFHRLEKCLSELETPVTFVRSAEHMENWRRVFGDVAQTNLLPSMHHPLTKAFPTVSAADVGRVTATLLRRPHPPKKRIVHVEGPTRITAHDVAAAFKELTEVTISAWEVPESEWAARLIQGGVGPAYAQLVAELYTTHNQGLIDLEPGVGEVVYGTTTLPEAFRLLKTEWRGAFSAPRPDAAGTAPPPHPDGQR